MKNKFIPALVLATSALLSGCGDSSGPTSLDTNGALQSLALGLQSTDPAVGSPTAPDLASIFAGIAPLVSQTSITIDGASQQMYAVGFRESFPDGTCEENLFVDPTFPPPPGVCTPPSMNTELVFWQSHSATQAPDRMLFVDTDPGTIDFDVTSSLEPQFLGFAIYVQGQNDVWSSLSGSMTSTVTGTAQTCSIPLPPYAKTATCSVANFDEQGQMVLEPFTLDQTSTRQMTIAIPRQTLHGFWLAITETQPYTITVLANRFRMLAPRLSRVAPYFRPAR
ncbi:MAG TPA: hypothetical protein VGG76_03120 [Gemmatimonadaceae bacterium]